jgi:hypothetical protein
MDNSGKGVTGARRQIPMIVGLILGGFLLLALLVGGLSADSSLALAEQALYLPLVRNEPAPATYYYFDDFSDDSSGWPIVYNPDPHNWFHWYYENGTYQLDIADDRTDVKASPGVVLPNGDYFRWYDPNLMNYWSSYGILFDGKDDPDPANPDLGDYFMLWILFEGPSTAKWTILNDMTGPGNQEPVGGWRLLSDSVYNYGDNGLGWNHWKIVRTDNSISVYCNGTLLETLKCGPTEMNCVRPRDNYQILFGLYGSTYETNRASYSWDNYLIELTGSQTGSWNPEPRGPVVVSGGSELDALLPHDGE